MKKTLLALILLGGGFAVGAQETQNTNTDSTRNTTSGNVTDSMTNNMNNNTTNNMNNVNADNTTRTTSNNYNAYGAAVNIPINVQKNFQTEFPTATDARWEQSNDLWRVNYKNNGQDMNMYYGANGQSFMIALPVLQNQVPEEVVTKVKQMHGHNVYDITTLRAVDSSEYYHIRLLEGGQLRSAMINADGSEWVEPVMPENNTMNATDSYAANNSNWNNNNNTNTGTGTDTTSTLTTDTTTGSGTTTPMTDSTATDNATGVNGTTTTDDNSAGNSGNQENNTTNAAGSEMNTTNNTTTGKDEKLKIKTKSSDGKETKVKVEKGEVKIKED